MKRLNQLLFAVFSAAFLFSACSKVQQASHPATATNETTSQDDPVPTPAGLLPRSHVHFIEDGNMLIRKNGHMYKAERKTGNLLEDFGEIGHLSSSQKIRSRAISKPVSNPVNVPGAEPTSWVTNSVWVNTSDLYIISNFTTNLTVPNGPTTTTDGQTLYIFEGLQNDTTSNVMIIQPVLEWGPNSAQPTWQNWGIANWCVWGPDLDQAAVTGLIAVDPATNLQGVLSYVGLNSGENSWEYSSSFVNPATRVTYDNELYVEDGDVGTYGGVIPQVPYMSYAFETLEAWHIIDNIAYDGVVSASDYPEGANYIDMNSIAMSLSGTLTAISWTADNDKNAVWGESTQVVSGSDVRLYWHPVPAINNTQLLRMTTTQTSYPITAYPGTTVNILLTGYARRAGLNGAYGTTTSYLTITTPGVTFTGGSTSVSATNSSNSYTLTMPASGSVSVTGYYTTTVESPPAIISSVVSVY